MPPSCRPYASARPAGSAVGRDRGGLLARNAAGAGLSAIGLDGASVGDRRHWQRARAARDACEVVAGRRGHGGAGPQVRRRIDVDGFTTSITRVRGRDLFTTQEAVIARIALPGVKPDDVDVSIVDDVVTIRGSFEKHEQLAEAGFVHQELSRGSFARSFVVPTPIQAETASASFTDGLLTLTLPKSDEVKPRHVKVEVSR